MHALAEKIGVDAPALDVIRLFSEISNLYTHYLAPMQTDTVHVSHFRFLILELNEELESLFDKNLSDDRMCRVSFLTQLKKKLHSLMNTCKKHKILTTNRPPLISVPANDTSVPENTLDIETKPHRAPARSRYWLCRLTVMHGRSYLRLCGQRPWKHRLLLRYSVF